MADWTSAAEPIFTTSTETANGETDSGRLLDEIQDAAGITPDATTVLENTGADTTTILFDADVSGGEQAAVEAVVLAHEGSVGVNTAEEGHIEEEYSAGKLVAIRRFAFQDAGVLEGKVEETLFTYAPGTSALESETRTTFDGDGTPIETLNWDYSEEIDGPTKYVRRIQQ